MFSELGRGLADFYSYDPATGHGLAHDPLKAIIAPRPIGWISTRSPDGIDNLAPYSFFNMISNRPPLLAFASEGRKDTLSNLLATGGFVHNLASRRQVGAMSQSSARYAADVDEFAAVGLEKIAAQEVDASIVAGAPAALECRLVQTVPLAGLEGLDSGTTLVIGQIVRVHIDSAYLTDELFDAVAAQTIARCGYRNAYAAIDEIFLLPRPERPL